MSLPSIVIHELETKSGLLLSAPSDADISTLSNNICEATGVLLSLNTMKRLLGRISDGDRQPRVTTLNAIARYLGRADWPTLLIALSNGSSSFEPIEGELLTDDIQPGQMVEVTYLPDRRIRFLYLGEQRFEVIESVNSKLQCGDQGLISAFMTHFPFIVRQVVRQGKVLSASYTAGQVSGLTSVSLL